ncbi:hypothetical protein ACFQGE_14040 [Halomicroarcula sp. GCM10025817]|uniref:hypothetical protein n=1 Tax=Haloarcula TaxID=2237 RepID=UPI0023E863EB|nr:hypothetical protein [Halomicroarcula sp. SYNS111]
MAQRLNLTFDHAIFDTYDYQRGAEPTFVPTPEESSRTDPLTRLLNDGDSALNREPGYFFETIGDHLVVVFEGKREDDLSRNTTMAYFDVFWAPVEAVSEASIKDVVNELRDARTRSFTADVDGSATVDVRRLDSRIGPGSNGVRQRDDARTTRFEGDITSRSDRPEQPPDESDSGSGADDEFVDIDTLNPDDGAPGDPTGDDTSPDDPGTDSAESPSPDSGPQGDRPTAATAGGRASGVTPPDSEYLAQFWEQYRRQGFQMYASLTQVDRFAYAVDGTLRALRCVSHQRKETDKFDVVIGDPVGRVELGDFDLVSHIESLDKEGALSVSNLPRYRDELDDLKRSRAKRIKSADTLFENLDSTLERRQSELETALRESTKESAELFLELAEGDADLEASESGGRFDRFKQVTSVVGGDDDEVARAIENMDLDEVSDAEAQHVVETVLVEEIQQGFAATYEEILDDLRADLAKFSENSQQQLAREVLDRVEDLRQSKAYERAGEE